MSIRLKAWLCWMVSLSRPSSRSLERVLSESSQKALSRGRPAPFGPRMERTTRARSLWRSRGRGPWCVDAAGVVWGCMYAVLAATVELVLGALGPVSSSTGSVAPEVRVADPADQRLEHRVANLAPLLPGPGLDVGPSVLEVIGGHRLIQPDPSGNRTRKLDKPWRPA